MICDMHVHSNFSVDSPTPLALHCAAAVERGIEVICFTEHVDYNPADPGFGFYDRGRYFDYIERLREQYAGRLTILAGAEFGEPHRYPKELEACRQYPYDFLLGSVHFWLGDMLPSEIRAADISVERSFELYWQQALLAARQGGFDAFGHLDYPYRFYRQSLYEEDMLKELFAALQENHILLEINTASLRWGYPAPNPGPEILDLYYGAGGRYVTFGSDAHKEGALGACFDQAGALAAAAGLKQVYFRQHKMIECG